MMILAGALFIILMITTIAFFAGVETGLFSVSPAKIRSLAEQGNRRAHIIQKLLETPDFFIGTALVGINTAHVTLSVVSAWFFSRFFHDESLTALVTACVVTPTVLLFGEILPKTLARLRPHATTLRYARVFRTFSILMKPVTSSVLWFANSILPATKASREQESERKKAEIRSLIREGEKTGVVEDDEKQMIESAFELGDKTVKEVMVPRVSMAAISLRSTHAEIMAYVAHENYTRYPVFDESPDEIIGILHVADLLIENKFEPERLAKPFYVPEFTAVDEALEQLRSQGGHMAIVVDEYGGTAGIVTIEDLLEELVGEIEDEHDDSHAKVMKLADGRWSIDARADLDEVAEQLSISFEELSSEAETIGGMILEQMGRIPRTGEKIELMSARIEVASSDERRIMRVIVEKKE